LSFAGLLPLRVIFLYFSVQYCYQPSFQSTFSFKLVPPTPSRLFNPRTVIPRKSDWSLRCTQNRGVRPFSPFFGGLQFFFAVADLFFFSVKPSCPEPVFPPSNGNEVFSPLVGFPAFPFLSPPRFTIVHGFPPHHSAVGY